MIERSPFSEEAEKTLTALIESKYRQVITDREEYQRFNGFLLRRGIPSRAYVLAYSLADGGYAWFRYDVLATKKGKSPKKLEFATKKPIVSLPADFTDRTIPESCRELPIWYLDGGKRDE